MKLWPGFSFRWRRKGLGEWGKGSGGGTRAIDLALESKRENKLNKRKNG